MIINKESFTKIQKELESFEEKREKTIQNSREIIKVSKQLIYAIHRDDAKIKELDAALETSYKKLDSSQSYDTSIASVAVQEYVEAKTYLSLMQEGKLVTPSELKVPVAEYLMGLCDLTGELMRRAVNAAIKQDKATVQKIRDFVDELYGYFLEFDLRNGELRKKSDAIKWNMKKIEDVLLNLK